MSTAAATSMPAFFFSRVGWDRQGGRKNNNGNPEFDRRHNFLLPAQTFAA
jgi:hypothetical protein